MQEPENTKDPSDSTRSGRTALFDSVGPVIKEFLSNFVVVGYRADNGDKVIVSDCRDLVSVPN